MCQQAPLGHRVERGFPQGYPDPPATWWSVERSPSPPSFPGPLLLCQLGRPAWASAFPSVRCGHLMVTQSAPGFAPGSQGPWHHSTSSRHSSGFTDSRLKALRGGPPPRTSPAPVGFTCTPKMCMELPGSRPALHGYRVWGRAQILNPLCLAESKSVIANVEGRGMQTHVTSCGWTLGPVLLAWFPAPPPTSCAVWGALPWPSVPWFRGSCPACWAHLVVSRGQSTPGK